jgi:DNA-binding response OmpR family regulator
MSAMSTSKRIALLVEDLPFLRDQICGHLAAEGFEVVATSDYQGAVRALGSCTPALVCLDLTLPRESGYELCEHIRQEPRLRRVPILVMSDRSSPEDMAHAEHVGANAYLKKPFTRSRFAKYVSALLYNPNASRPSVRRLRLNDD